MIMARPIKNNCDYFPHDNDMRNHVKVKAVRNKFQNGYAIWSMLLEYLTGSDGNTFENSELQMELLSGDFGVSVTEIKDVVNYCIRLEMLFEKDGWIYSESLNERLFPVYEKRGRAKQFSAKQRRINGSFCDSNAVDGVVSVAEMPQIKVNKIKENKRKEIIKEKFDFLDSLVEIGIDKKIASDWLVVRKTKKAANTETAFNAIKHQIELSGLPANECVKIATENSWQGFKAEWLKSEGKKDYNPKNLF